jgi:putative ABC transport system permease protein
MELLRLALRNLTRRRARTILTILGVAIAIAFTVGILSISEGFMTSFENAVEKQDVDIVVVPKDAEAMPFPDAAAAAGDFSEEIVGEIEAIDNVSAVYPMLTGILGQSGGEDDATGMFGMGIVSGVPDGYLENVLPYLEVDKGSMPDPWEGEVLVVGSGMAAQHKLDLGDSVQIGRGDFEVVAILKSSGTFDDAAYYAPLEAIQVAYGKEATSEAAGRVNYVGVKVEDPNEADETASEINQLEDYQGLVSAQTMDEVVDKMGELLNMARSIHFALGAVALLIGVLFILSTMLMAVSERVREIGTMRAIGVHRNFVFRMIITESTMTSLVAGGIGCLGGYLLSRIITFGIAEVMGVTYMEAQVTPRIIILGMVIALFMGVLAGLYPAWRIARSNIVEALRYE